MSSSYPPDYARSDFVGSSIAALDLGTNNCRLLIADVDETGFSVTDSFSRIVRLGEGLSATGRLSEAAMARTLDALRVCGRLMQRHKVLDLRCVATEACRQAVNGLEFIDRVYEDTGIELEILGQKEEARLAMLGCLPLIDLDADYCLMVDIGGGSTEIMWLDRRPGSDPSHADWSVSLPLGVVTLSELYDSDAAARIYDEMVAYAASIVHAAALRSPAGGGDRRIQMLGTSGTVTTLAAVHLGLRRYDRRRIDGFEMPFSAIEAVSRKLIALSNAGRAAHPCIGRGRADLVVAGCAILDAIHQRWPIQEMRVADRGVREGILSTILGVGLDRALRPMPEDA